MESQAVHVMTITNSIIGVSLLAMPYCFKQCGIILSIVMLMLSNAIARLCCHLMLKSAVIARRRTFEFLAFHAFGSLGKFSVEIGLIGFLLGTCIAYFVVMGDLGPAILAKLSNSRPTDTMRTSILLALALFCVLPLGLLRNIDSLSSVCTITVLFYFALVLKIISEAVPHIITGDWINRVEIWRPSGVLQCLPIFSMALSCQTQIFEIYQALPTVSVEKMNHLIGAAVNICTGVYICVGIFGYVAFATQTFSGNILMSFSPSFMTDLMKIGFVLSLAFSFPLIIFPCRASLNSLLCRRYSYTLHDSTDKYIPESRFKGLTFMIVLISLLVGLMIPSIELVLGLLGSTIGVMICVLFPATCFICVSTKNTNERILAQFMLFIGILTMVLGTYANLYIMDEVTSTTAPTVPVEIPKIIKEIQKLPVPKVEDKQDLPIETELFKKKVEEVVRHEPPQPEEPVVEKINEVLKSADEVKKDVIKTKADVEEVKEKPVQTDERPKKVEEVDIEAIKKEEKEILEEQKQKLEVVDQQNMNLIKKMEQQNEVNKQVAEESKKLLEQIKQRQMAEDEIKKLKDEKIKAVKEIQEIAKKTIEKIGLVETKDEPVQDKEKSEDQRKKESVQKDVKPVEKAPIDVRKPLMLPIPLVKSNLTNRTVEMLEPVVVPGIKTTLKPIVLDPVPEKKQEAPAQLNLTNDSSVKAKRNKAGEESKEEKVLHREIRDVDEKERNIIKTETELRQTGENKVIHNLTPITVVTKIGESLVNSINLPDLDNKGLSLQPLKRDLKNYKETRR